MITLAVIVVVLCFTVYMLLCLLSAIVEFLACSFGILALIALGYAVVHYIAA